MSAAVLTPAHGTDVVIHTPDSKMLRSGSEASNASTGKGFLDLGAAWGAVPAVVSQVREDFCRQNLLLSSVDLHLSPEKYCCSRKFSSALMPHHLLLVAAVWPAARGTEFCGWQWECPHLGNVPFVS